MKGNAGIRSPRRLRLHQEPGRSPLLGGRAGGRRRGAAHLSDDAGGQRAGGNRRRPRCGWIVNPTYYWRSRGVNRSGSKSTVEPTKWGHTTVKKILTLQEYCGDVINFKSYSKSYKMKKRIENPEENRAIFLNVHEAIIDRATWEKVQALTKGTRRKRTPGHPGTQRVLRLPEMPRVRRQPQLPLQPGQPRHQVFQLPEPQLRAPQVLVYPLHPAGLLERVVLYEVNRLAAFASEYEDAFIKAIMGRSAKVAENARVRKQRELDGLLARTESWICSLNGSTRITSRKDR